VRVRLTRIDNEDLNLFEFDYDLTMMVFFLNAEGKVYARYGGRDGRNADNRQSLAGLAYTMQSVLAMHAQDSPTFAPRTAEGPKYIRGMAGRGGGRCMHCHQVKENLNGNLKRTGQWTPDMVWRYPLPENLGITLEVDRGNIVKQIAVKSPAAVAGLQVGDRITRLGTVPIHSFGDAQFALDIAPKTGTLAVAWQRGKALHEQQIALADGWRKTDISWRPSVQHLVASLRLYGDDLTAQERKTLGLSPTQLAFRQQAGLSRQAREAGIHVGDIILGLDGRTMEMDVNGLIGYVRRSHLVGDRVTVNLLRDGKRMDVPMTLLR
jgi:serine protease Do